MVQGRILKQLGPQAHITDKAFVGVLAISRDSFKNLVVDGHFCTTNLINHFFLLFFLPLFTSLFTSLYFLFSFFFFFNFFFHFFFTSFYLSSYFPWLPFLLFTSFLFSFYFSFYLFYFSFYLSSYFNFHVNIRSSMGTFVWVYLIFPTCFCCPVTNLNNSQNKMLQVLFLSSLREAQYTNLHFYFRTHRSKIPTWHIRISFVLIIVYFSGHSVFIIHV